eukprot:GEMP01056584.1.p2 GENE.GEMP01056584.1~~GEMP01056584.1.p2  ORF type:complete len:103 (-),score=6.28 GEMP01056584.1:479-787(-)
MKIGKSTVSSRRSCFPSGMPLYSPCRLCRRDVAPYLLIPALHFPALQLFLHRGDLPSEKKTIIFPNSPYLVERSLPPNTRVFRSPQYSPVSTYILPRMETSV